MIKNICVFCGASDRVEQKYKNLASELGVMLAKRKLNLVYGGGSTGLMGAVAKTTHENGSKVTAVYPRLLDQFEPLSHDLDNTIIVDTMSKRKDLMIEKSDAFVILPGGFGTLDEVFEIITLKILNQHSKPIIFINFDNFWAGLIRYLDEIIAKDFAKLHARSCYDIVDTLEELFVILPA